LSRPLSRRLGAWLVLGALLLSACTEPDHTSADFCNKLGEITGPSGVESALIPGDPARIDGVVSELSQLHDRAPDEISATTRTLLTFFRDYQQAARDERRDVIAANEQRIAQASANLDSYALTECGLLLQRTVPTPIPPANPSIEPQITD